MVLTGPKNHAAGFIEGLDLMAGTRLCPNVPAQHAIQVALGGKQSIYELTAETGRLHRQRDVAFEKLNEIPGVSVTKSDRKSTRLKSSHVSISYAVFCFNKIISP